MADVFLSYASGDASRVRPLVERLEERGLAVWWDRKIPPGKRFARVIEEELDAAHIVVVVWSHDSVQSEWVEDEAAEGKRKGVLVPVFIDDVRDRLPLQFRGLEGALIWDWDGDSAHEELELFLDSVIRLRQVSSVGTILALGSTQRVPVRLLKRGDFVSSVDSADLVYFLLNVRDADSQLFLLPAGADGDRHAIVVDLASEPKFDALLGQLEATSLWRRPRPGERRFPLVVGTQADEAHVAGMAAFLSRWRDSVEEYWEPGVGGAFAEYDEAVRALPEIGIHRTQPTAGTRRLMRGVDVLAMTPTAHSRQSAALGTDAVNAVSITLRLDLHGYSDGGSVGFVLGSGSMLTDWDDVERLYGAGPTGSDEPVPTIFKVPRHPTRGLGMHVIDAIAPSLILVSARPHDPQPEGLDELIPLGHALAPIPDREVPPWELGIHDTSATDTRGQPLGTIALVVAPTGRKRELWRFNDDPDERVDLTRGSRFSF